MRIGIISDTHLGDAGSKLVRDGVAPEDYRTIPAFKALCDALNPGGKDPVDFLVLNGDTLDFSINSFEESCAAARPFFQALVQPGINLAKHIIVIPGNHDKQLWDAVEWERHITMKMHKHEPPEAFTRTQPGVIRYPDGGLSLPGVSRRPDGTYGGLFLEGLFDQQGPSVPIAAVYPNLYIETPNDVYMVTHGHMLEAAWVLLSEQIGDYVRPGQSLGLHELEEFNIPLTAAVCSGVGGAGDVTKLFYAIQVEAKNKQNATLARVLDHVLPKVDKMVQLWWGIEWLDNLGIRLLRKRVLKMALGAGSSRYDSQFFRHEEVQQRFATFYRAAVAQATGTSGLDLRPPNKIIFGHTHEPIPQSRPMKVRVKDLPGTELVAPGVDELALFNTGGWLPETGASAEVFLFDDEGNLTSRSVTEG